MKYLLAAVACPAGLLFVASYAGGATAPGRAALSAPRAEARARVGEIRFPEEWLKAEPGREGREPPEDFSLPMNPQQLEVRRAEGAPAGEFLFGAMEYDSDYEFEYQPDLPRPDYSENFFAVDFERGFGVRKATPEEWGRAARVSHKPRLLYAAGGDQTNEQGHSQRREVEYLGKKFARTGDYWRAASLSPSGRWLAVFSYSGRVPPRSFFDFLGGGGPATGDVFWDLYDTATGEKVLAWEARGVRGPMWWDSTALWVGDRYFIWDGADRSQTLAVAALPDFTPGTNPGEVRFPRWLAADGTEMPAGARYEVRRAPAPARELLFALRAEVEREVRYLTDDRPRREATMRRRETLRSANFYAVSLDGEYSVRAATREEWQASEEVRNTRHEFRPDETFVYDGRRRRRHRPLAKSGASWGTPPALGGGTHWVALFSHTGAAQGAGGRAFVDVYERLTGLKMLEGRFGAGGATQALFAGALWADESYLVVPTDAASRACLLFMLPETNRAC